MSRTDSANHIAINRILQALVFIIIPLAFGGISLLLGKDVNWDLKNYHYYNAYAFLENRLDFDIVPAQLQTYINPVADIPFYWMVKYFPSWVSGFVLGVIHGLNLSLILLIFWRINNDPIKWNKLLLGVCVVIVSGLAPGFVSELGNTMHDNLTSLFVLFALFLLLRSMKAMDEGQNKRGLLHLANAGLVMGMGVGIKPSVTVFAISTAMVFILFQRTWIDRLKSIFVYGAAGMAGGLFSAGFWWLEMWKRFRNPFFPFYNHIFKSPYFTTTPVNWSAYLPNSLWEYLAWPFIITLDSLRTNQFYFFDIRFALLYILFLVWLVLFILRRFNLLPPAPLRTMQLFDRKAGSFLLLFFLLSYILWLKESATYRFLIPLELLVPLCFLILLDYLFPSKRTQMILAISAAILLAVLFRPFNWGRLDWSSPYFEVDTGHLDQSKGTIVVILGRSPVSYVIPEFPKDFRFVRPEGNLFSFRDVYGKISSRSDDKKLMFTAIKSLIENQQGYFYIIYNKNEENLSRNESLLDLELTNPNIEECFLVKVNTPDILEMCKVSR